MENRFRENLNYLMAEGGVSQTDIAGKLQVPRQTVNNWVMGNSKPNAYRASLVADMFGVSVADLIYSDLTIPQKPKKSAPVDYIAETPAGSVVIEKSPDDLRQKDALRRLLAYAVLLNDGDLDMVADMAERLAGKDGKR